MTQKAVDLVANQVKNQILIDDAYLELDKDGSLITVNTTHFMGVIDCSTNPNYPAAKRGDFYAVSVAGKIGGVAGVVVDASDVMHCITTTVSGNQAAVGSNWVIVNRNVIGAVTNVTGGSDKYLARYDGATGLVIQDSTVKNDGDETTIVRLKTTKGRIQKSNTYVLPHTITIDDDIIIMNDPGAGACFLPLAASVPGSVFEIKNISTSAMGVGSLLGELIDGVAALTLYQNDSITISNDGVSAWFTIANINAADVTGPASATDEYIPVFDGTTGRKIKASGSSIVGTLASFEQLYFDLMFKCATYTYSDDTLLSEDDFFITSVPAGNVNLTLPEAGTKGPGIFTYVRNLATTPGNTVTMLPHAGEFIDEAASVVIGPGEARIFVSNQSVFNGYITVSQKWGDFVTVHDFRIDGAYYTNQSSINASQALDNAYYLVFGTAAGVMTLTLPPVATYGAGIYYLIKNVGGGVLTVDGNAAETIDGALTLDLAINDAVWLVSDGAAWKIVGHHTANDANKVINTTGAVTDLQVAIFNGTTGKVIKNSSATINGDLTTLVQLKTTKSRFQNINTYTGDQLLDTTNDIVICNKASAMTITLPAAATVANIVYQIKNKGAGTVTVDPNGAETIDGDATLDLLTYESVTICSDGAAWWVL